MATAVVILFKGDHIQNISLALRALGSQYVRLFDLFGPEEILEAARLVDGPAMYLTATTAKAPPPPAPEPEEPAAPPKEDPDATQG